MHIDCDSCAVRGLACGDCVVSVLLACGDCVVSVLLGAPPDGVHVDETERRALAVLADRGLVPPLRLVVLDAQRDVS
jgi:hypothetical protein